MGNVKTKVAVSDQLEIKSIARDCLLENFTAKRIPGLLKHDTSLNLHLNSFISKNFLRISNGEYFLEFPVEIVAHILSLDLCIENEYQVFEAILKWINHDQSRHVHLPKLMKYVRWCFASKKCLLLIKQFIVENFPQLPFEEIACESDVCWNLCSNSRIKEKNLIFLTYSEDNFVSVSFFNNDNRWEDFGSFEEDNQILTGIISDEHVVDVIFDSGRSGMRLDFVEKKYRWLEMSGSPSAYYNQLYNCFKPKFDKQSSYRAYIQDEVDKIEHWVDLEKNTFIENSGVANIICYPQKDNRLYCFLPVEHAHWFNSPFDEKRVHAVISKDSCYIITKSLTFRVFDMTKKTLVKSKPFKGMNLSFEDLLLDTHKSDVILLIKSQNKIMLFDTRKKTWKTVGEIFVGKKIIAVTSTYIPVQFMKKVVQKND